MRIWIAALALTLGLCGVEGRADEKQKTLPEPIPAPKGVAPEVIPAPESAAAEPPAAAVPETAPACGGGCETACGHRGGLLAFLFYRPTKSGCGLGCCPGRRPTPVYYYFMCHPCYEGCRPVCASCAGGCGCAGH